MKHEIFALVTLVVLVLTLINMRKRQLAWKPSTAFFTLWASIIGGIILPTTNIFFGDYLYAVLLFACFVILAFCAYTGHVNAVERRYVFKITHFSPGENRTYGEISLNKTPHKAYYEGTSLTCDETIFVRIYKEDEKLFWVEPIEG